MKQNILLIITDKYIYEFNATWEGNTNYNGATFNGEFTINKTNPSIKVDVDDVEVGKNTTIKVTLPEDVKGNVTIVVDGKNYTVNLKDGIATKNITITKTGTYTVDVVYNSDNNYNPIKGDANFTVSKISNYNITIDTENITFGQNATIKVTLPSDVNEVITIAIDNKNYTAITKDGVASIEASGLVAGEHEVTVTFENDKYSQKSANATFKVSKISDYLMNVTVPDDIKAGENITILVNLPKDANGDVIITINNTNYSGIAKNGFVNITIPGLPAGDYNATISYNGDDKYNSKELNTTIKVANKNEVILTTDNVTMIYKDGSRLYATLLDSKANPVANATILFTINRITYNRTTDANGTASIAINLEYRVYNALISYENTFVNATVTVKSSIIGNDLVKMWMNGTQFYASFLGKGATPLANTNVTFNINGVFYTHQTNESSIARLNINLDPNTYILTAYNPFSGEQRGPDVLVKPLIETSDLTKYYNNASNLKLKYTIMMDH